MPDYIDPLTDFGFKKLFGTEPNKVLLIDLLNLFLPKHHQIKDLTYSKSEYVGASKKDRKAIFDLFCDSPDGEKFIVEVQRTQQDFFIDRSIFYSTFPIQEQAKRGKGWNYELKPVYTVAFLDFKIKETDFNENLVHRIHLKDEENQIFYDKLTYIYVELPKFSKTIDQLETRLDKWLYIFRHLAELSNYPEELNDKVFDQLFEVASVAKMSKENRQRYEAELKAYRDAYSELSTAENKGRRERSFEIAASMKQEGVAMEIISRTTGLSFEEIEKL